MKIFIRKNTSYSLCGLNCCLCQRYNTEGSSKCPGCGGENFNSQHPTCAVITCSKKHNNIEYCFECKEYPCKKYENDSSVDSFISYKDVNKNFSEAQKNLHKYLNHLNLRYEYLQILLKDYNDGRSKGFYCLCANLFPLDELKIIMLNIGKLFKDTTVERKEKIIIIREVFEKRAKELNIEIKLRK